MKQNRNLGYKFILAVILIIALFFSYQYTSTVSHNWRNINSYSGLVWDSNFTMFFSGELTLTADRNFTVTTTDGEIVATGMKDQSTGTFTATYPATASKYYRVDADVTVKSTTRTEILFVWDPFNINLDTQ